MCSDTVSFPVDSPIIFTALPAITAPGTCIILPFATFSTKSSVTPLYSLSSWWFYSISLVLWSRLLWCLPAALPFRERACLYSDFAASCVHQNSFCCSNWLSVPQGHCLFLFQKLQPLLKKAVWGHEQAEGLWQIPFQPQTMEASVLAVQGCLMSSFLCFYTCWVFNGKVLFWLLPTGL